MKKLWKKFIEFLRKIFNCNNEDVKPTPTPTLPKPKFYWFKLNPTFITEEPALYFSEMYTEKKFKVDDRVIDENKDIYIVVEVLKKEPQGEPDKELNFVSGLEKTLLK
jgi:hypothetical protein